MRTALALTAGGVAPEALGVPREAGLRMGASVLCLVLGALVPVLAWVSWARTERAARGGDALPAPVLSPVLAVGVSGVGVLVLLGQL